MTQIGSQWSFCGKRARCCLPKGRLSMLRIWAQWKKKVTLLGVQLCPTLCDPMNCSSQGSSGHGIVQARVLEWVAIPFSRESSKPRDRSWVSHIAGRFFTLWGTREAPTQGWVPSNIKHWNSFMRSDSFHVFVPILCCRDLKKFNYILIL